MGYAPGERLEDEQVGGTLDQSDRGRGVGGMEFHRAPETVLRVQLRNSIGDRVRGHVVRGNVD
jgi:hypothetical protein